MAGEANFLLEEQSSSRHPRHKTCKVEVNAHQADVKQVNPPAGCGRCSEGLVRWQRVEVRIRLTGPNPLDPLPDRAHHLSDPERLKAAI